MDSGRLYTPDSDYDLSMPRRVSAYQKALKTHGIALTVEADETTTGPTYRALVDPDGNPILIDQH